MSNRTTKQAMRSVLRTLVGSSVCCVALGVGCTTTGPLATNGNWLAQKPVQPTSEHAKRDLLNLRSDATTKVATRIAPPSQPAAPITPASALTQPVKPTVTTVSYTEPPTNNTTTNATGSTASASPNQLAGHRKTLPSRVHGPVAGNADCLTCPPESGVVMGENCGECLSPQVASRAYDAQEFICDGGDRDPSAVVRKDWSAVGVDPTDTVMYYETAGGKVCITPSNRTCVYAPRFGAVRQVTGAMLADSALSTGRVHAPLPAHGLGDVNRAGNVAQSEKTIGQRQVQLLDRFVDQQKGLLYDSVVPPTPVGTRMAPQVSADRALADVSLSREWVDLLQDRVEVVTLINNESIHVEIGSQEAVAVLDTKTASEFTLYETPDGCTIRLTKTASHQIASSGDRIRFTIRFENVGTQKLGNAVILDSLSPRLKYIEESQLCSVDARFSVESNEAGSNILRWDIQSPIESQQSGVISFDCEVR